MDAAPRRAFMKGEGGALRGTYYGGEERCNLLGVGSMDGRAFRLEGALEVGLGELEDELEEELEDELEELEELEEDVGGDVVVVEGLWTFLGLSQPNLLKPLTGRAWAAGAFAGLGGPPLFLLGRLGA